jgi:DNA-binding transcriptional MocR family regulator
VQFGNTVETIFSLANQPDIVPLGVANPSPELLPVRALNRALRDVASRAPQATVNYTFPPGNAELRRQIAFRAADFGSEVDPNDVIITTGATEAISVALQTVAKPGDIIAVESPTYFSGLQIIERLGMLALEIDTDPQEGMCLDALERALKNHPVKAVLTVGNFSNPTGGLMPDVAKAELVEILAEHDIPLIEDDVMGDLHFGELRPRSCQAFDREGRVITCSSFSKTVAPGYRVGWVLPGRYRQQIMQGKQLASSASASVTQMAMAEFLASGQYDRHLARLRRACREQVERLRYAVAEHFPAGTRVTRPQGGSTLWVQLPRGVDSNQMYQEALRAGISVTPGTLFSATGKYQNFIRLCAGHPWSPQIERAVHVLGDIAAAMSLGERQ